MDGDEDSWTIPPNVINTYCYIMSTFILPSHLAGSIGHDVAAPGVGTYNHETGDVTFKAYYQWVPFVLFMQACLFYAPHLLYKMWEGGKVSFFKFLLTENHPLFVDKVNHFWIECDSD